ncbi:uncharacterized protein PAC_13331 [Phialocephala subalpina]|uniref:Uncharacterized protein n=1 Tax=Phialocephala subalpina TaxID=576137 RepID=A0A1L7XEI1_9HELO|nr:uncharacterized protein PAC_13331 [Phialocephala subalpina]
MFLDSRSKLRGKRSHGLDRGCGHSGGDYELLAHYAALGGGQGQQYGYGREGKVRLDEVPMLRKRRGPRGNMLDRLGGGLLGVQRGELSGMNGEFLGGHGGLGLGSGLGGFHHSGIPAVPGGGFGPFDGGGGHLHGLGCGIDFMGQTHAGQHHQHHGIGGLGGHRMVPELRGRMRGMRGATGMEDFDGSHHQHGPHGHIGHGHVHQNHFGGPHSGTGLEDKFSAMDLNDHRRRPHRHQHRHVHPMPPAGHHHGPAHQCTAQAPASHGSENISRAGHGPNDSECPPPGSNHHRGSRTNSTSAAQSFDMHAMDRPRMPYHYRHPYVEEGEGGSDAELQADMQRRAAMGEVFPASRGWYDGSLMDLYYIQ